MASLPSLPVTAVTLEGDAAAAAGFKTIKKLYPRLSTAVVRGQIPEKLYSKDLIDEEVMEIVISEGSTTSKKGRRIVKELQSSVTLRPSSFFTIVEILKEEAVSTDLAVLLEGASNIIVW